MIRLLLFVAVFLAIYAAMHALVFWGTRPLLPPRGALLLAAVMALAIALPIVVRMLDRAEIPLVIIRPLAVAGYVWMGYLFLAFALFLPLGGYHLARAGSSPFFPSVARLPGHGPKAAAFVLLLALAAGTYGLVEASRLRIERVRLPTPKLPAETGAVRLVQISDLHLGLLSRDETARKVAEAIAPLKPDLIVVTGDMVDAQIDHVEKMAEPFSALRPPLGMFAVTGNHEVYAGLPQSLSFLRRAGFTILRNETAPAGEWLTVAGVDDPAAGSAVDEASLLRTAPAGRFTILLKHRPQVDLAAASLFDLQLSGHTHRGQIFPFNFLTALFYPLQDGLYPLTRGSQLYTSRGTGSWGPPMRLHSPPEITLFEIVPAPPPALPGG